MKDSRQRQLLGAAIAGIIGAGLLAAQAKTADNVKDRWTDAESAKCYGINKCAGQGACKGASHQCGGMVNGKEKACGGSFKEGGNSCKGAGFLRVPKAVCEHIQNGSLEPIKGLTKMGGDKQDEDDDDDNDGK